jgi:hypothetical protein
LAAGLALGLMVALAAQAQEAVPETTKKTGDDVIAQIDAFIAEKKIDKSRGNWKTSLPKPPKLAFQGETVYWNLDTNVGAIKISSASTTAWPSTA